MRMLSSLLLVGALGLLNGFLINLWLDLQVVDLACTYSLSPAEIATDQKD